MKELNKRHTIVQQESASRDGILTQMNEWVLSQEGLLDLEKLVANQYRDDLLQEKALNEVIGAHRAPQYKPFGNFLFQHQIVLNCFFFF